LVPRVCALALRSPSAAGTSPRLMPEALEEPLRPCRRALALRRLPLLLAVGRGLGQQRVRGPLQYVVLDRPKVYHRPRRVQVSYIHSTSKTASLRA